MSTTAEVFESSRNRSVGLRKRSDLTVVEHVYRDEPYWLIKDPLEMEFYRLNEEEFTVLELVDGKQSLDDIKQVFEKRFTPQRITHRQLQTFISDLYKKSLLAYVDSDVGPRLVEREKEKKLEKLKKNFSNVLTPKWRGVDPDRFLDFITPKVGWVFSAPAVIVSLLFMCAAVLWLLTHYDTFQAKLPALESLLGQENWLLLGAVVMTMKIVHELAHGISFKRFGGECHEIGVMLLVLIIPTLYCSTTDSWLLKSKWKRAAIGAAGMYVELLIAAIATFVWWFSEPGTLNMLCLNIMATGTVSVVLLNGNPFFKFDGYYIFSDILELPNLRERAGKQTQGLFLKYGLGVDEEAEPNSRFSTKAALVTYKLFAFTFKLLVIVLIKFMLIDKLNAYGLGYAGLAIGVFALGSLLVPPFWGLYKFFKIPGRLDRIEMKHSIPLLIVCGLVTALLFAVPFPHYVKCPFTIQPRDVQSVYVRHDALLKRILVEPGQQVETGELIAELENLDSSLQLARLKVEGAESLAELQLLEQTRESSPKTTARIAKLRESLHTNRNSVRELEEIVASFRVISPRSGQIIPEWTGRRPQQGLKLESFDGSPFRPDNIGCWLPSGQKLCSVGKLTQFDAVLVVNEHDISFIEPGQAATLMLDSLTGQRIEHPIASVAKKETERLPGSLAKGNGGSIQLEESSDPEATESDSSRPSDEHFESRVALPDMDTTLSVGLRGQARIEVGSKTIFQRFMMLAFRNFRKKLH